MLIPDDEQTVKEFNAEIGLILGMMKPRFLSYRSGQLVFDSAVFQSDARGLDRAPAHLQAVKKAEMAMTRLAQLRLRGPAQLQVPTVARPRNQRHLQREVVGFRRPLRLYGGPEHGRQIPSQLPPPFLRFR